MLSQALISGIPSNKKDDRAKGDRAKKLSAQIFQSLTVLPEYYLIYLNINY